MIRRLATALIIVLTSWQVFAQAPVPEAVATNYVNDFAGLLSAEQELALNEYLRQFQQATGHQMAVTLMDLPEDNDVESFTNDLAGKSGVGGKAENDGILIAVYPNVRKMRIEVGYGLEGDVTDIFASNVIEQYLKPAFVQNDYYGGLANGIQVLAKQIAPDFQADFSQPVPIRRVSRREEPKIPGIVVMIFIAIIFLYLRNGGGGGKGGRGGRGGGMWFPFLLLGGGGNYGGGGGGFGGGGGGGGGFGGFGGGGFGGGGASGSW